MVVLTLPGIKTVHFVYAFGLKTLCFPCNSVLLCEFFQVYAMKRETRSYLLVFRWLLLEVSPIADL